MKLAINTSTYNERRYGKPWIALVTFGSSSKADFNFGSWVGDAGYEGILELDVNLGDIVARGQKDNRKPANSTPVFYIIDSETKSDDLVEPVSKKDAYLHTKQVVSVSSLQAERDQLVTRIAKIDELLKQGVINHAI